MLIDLLFLITLGIAAIKGYRKGLVLAVFSLLALVVGIAAAMKLSLLAAEWLKGSVHVSPKLLPIVAFALVFLVVLMLVRLAAEALESVIEFTLLGWVNRLGGVLLYAVLYTVIFSVVLFYAEKANLVSERTLSGSVLRSFILPWGPRAMDTIGVLLPFFKNMFHDLEVFFQGIAKGYASAK